MINLISNYKMTEVYSIKKRLKKTIFNLLHSKMDLTEARQITIKFINDGDYQTLKKILSTV